MAIHQKGEDDVIAKSKTLKFPQFDIISPTDANHHDLISDHYFSSNHDHLSQKATAYIMREWNILKDSLPSFIYVRAFEGRIDLLTAVIIGRAGSPFHQGLFVFDIQFTSDYPNSHPKFQRRYADGLLLNPTLNPGRDVCYAQLKPKKYRMSPMEYSMLEILLSIRVNIITSKPEPTCSGQSSRILPTFWGYWMEKEYLTFNQDMFMLNCQTMMSVLNKPPKCLEEFVVQHFRDHAESILIACKSYIDPSPPKVDKYASNKDEYRIQADDSAFSTTTTPIKEEWEEYKISMRNIYVELVKAFINNGSNISMENYVNDEDHNNVAHIDDDVVDMKNKHRNLGFWVKLLQCWRFMII
ncbi:putative ubiquitin-conjugating enzyme E2 38 [Papaver somniferum]|uniref:putative ubiquitin-conjugating enzyme E2 38 n=1 Tax=Papaver somniferum TaxID=3469 RepID=UPI000E702B20|nr:putative ubiquitin-conjugating enzyme E2 38 [Papaver somniferum]